MKKLTFLLVVLSVATLTYAYEPATIFLHNDTQLEGFVEWPNVDARSVNFRADRSSRVQRVSSNDIRLIRFLREDGNFLDIERVQVNASVTNNPLRRWHFLSVVERGPVTLYYIVVRNVSRSHVTNIPHYFAKREGEAVAQYMWYNQAGVLNDPFRRIGSNFFETNPSISEKIRNKEEGYTHRDIVQIVREYNAWASTR